MGLQAGRPILTKTVMVCKIITTAGHRGRHA